MKLMKNNSIAGTPGHRLFEDPGAFWWLAQAAARSLLARYVCLAIVESAQAANWRKGEAPFPLLHSICARIGLTPRLVKRGLAELEQAGIVKVHRDSGKTMAIELIFSTLLPPLLPYDPIDDLSNPDWKN